MRPLLALLGLLLGAPSTEQVCVPMPINTWVALPTEGAPPQNARRIRWLDGRLWYLGETVTAFDPCTNSWRSLPNTGRPKKPTEWFDSISKIVGVAGKLVVIKEDVGGVTERDGFSVAIIDERGWRVLAIEIPMEPVVAATDREVLIWGGSRDRRIDEARSVVDTVGTGVRIDPIRATVTPITTKNAPSPRTGTNGVWTGTQLFIWGGIAKPNHWRGCSPSGGCTIVSDGALYDPQADNWTPIASHGSPQGRTGAHVALLGSRVIVFGGFGYSAVEGGGLRTLYDGGIYDPQTDRWDPIGDGSELFQGLNGFRILPSQRAIVVPVNSDGLRYDLTTRTWSQLPPTHFDNEKSSLESIAEGEGRFYSNGKDLELQRFDAEKAIWQEAKLPSSTLHHGHDVAWAGDRLVVWRSWIQVHDPGGDNGCRNPDPDIHCDPISPMKSVKRPAGAMIIPIFRNRPGDEADWSRVRVGGMMALFGALAALVGIGFSIRRRRRSRSLGPATAQLQSERL